MSKQVDQNVDAGKTHSKPPSGRPDWRDPKVPAGDSPPLPRWPLTLSALAWGGWVAFLVVMMVIRLRS